jgi:exosortase
MRQAAFPMNQESITEGNGSGVAVAKPIRQPRLGLSTEAWVKIAIITALFVCLFWPNLRRLWEKTNPFYGEANWGHAICIPFIGLYFLYVNRRQLMAPEHSSAPSRRWAALRVWGMLAVGLGLPLILVREVANTEFLNAVAGWAVFAAVALGLCMWRADGPFIARARRNSAVWFGVLVLLFGIELVAYAIYPGQNDFLKDFGMVITLMGVVTAAAGWGIMRIAWFPIAFLVCGIPWPGLMYSRIASPLQQLAANVAVWTLELTGVESSAWGTKIFIIGHGGMQRTLNVAEACAGLRSLMTFISVGAAVAFLSNRPLWQKIIVTLSAIPIAIFCNVMRVSGQGLLDHYVSQQLSEDFAHQFVGMIMLIPAFLLILLVGWMLDQIFVEEVERGEVMAPTKVIRRSSPAAMVVGARPPAVRTPTAIKAVPVPAAKMDMAGSAAVVKSPPPRSLAAAKAASAASRSASPRPTGATPPPTVRLASRPLSPERKAPAAKPAGPTNFTPPNPPRKEAI